MPHVLDRYGLSLEQEPDSAPPAKAAEAIDLFEVMISCLVSLSRRVKFSAQVGHFSRRFLPTKYRAWRPFVRHQVPYLVSKTL